MPMKGDGNYTVIENNVITDNTTGKYAFVNAKANI